MLLKEKYINAVKYNNSKLIKNSKNNKKARLIKGIKAFMLLIGSFLGMLYARHIGSYVFFGVFFTLYFLVLVDLFEKE